MKDKCFLCRDGMCFLQEFNEFGYTFNLWTSMEPDLDPRCEKGGKIAAHLMVAPKIHYSALRKMSQKEYVTFSSAIRKVFLHYLELGYGPSITLITLDPGKVKHPHGHIILSTNALGPLVKERRVPIKKPYLEFLKEHIKENPIPND